MYKIKEFFAGSFIVFLFTVAPFVFEGLVEMVL